MRLLRFLLYLVISLSAFISCKQGEKLVNTPPDTRLIIDSIVQPPGQNGLLTSVRLSWSGFDNDGIVKGFELSQDGGQNWSFVPQNPLGRNDSTFSFKIPVGINSIALDFRVRAIDDQNAKDPTPARVSIPVQNSKPAVQFDQRYFYKDTIPPSFNFRWDATDPDGAENLSQVYIALNNGPFVAFPIRTNNITITPRNPTVAGTTDALIYERGNTPLQKVLAGLNLQQGSNRIRAYAVDQSGLASDTIESPSFVMNRVTAKLLLMDGWFVTPRAISTFRPVLNEVYGRFDYVDLTDSVQNLPPERNTTYRYLFKQYEQVFWYMSVDQNQIDFLEASENIIQESLNENRKIFISAPLSDRFDAASSLFRYTPADSVSSIVRNGLIPRDTVLIPAANGRPFPRLLNGANQFISVNPFYIKSTSEAIYTAPLLTSGGQPWPEQNRIVVAANRNASNRLNLVFSSIPLQTMSGEVNGKNGLIDFFKRINEEFTW
jgi:hypothetical protein